MTRTRAPDLGFAPPPRPMVVEVPADLVAAADALALQVRGLDMAGCTAEECARVAARCEDLALRLRGLHRVGESVIPACRGV